MLHINDFPLIHFSLGEGCTAPAQRSERLDCLAIAYLAEVMDAKGKASAVDLGCGRGNVAVRMAETGATVAALDVCDFTDHFIDVSSDLLRRKLIPIQFEQIALSHLVNPSIEYPTHLGAPWNVVVCQRTIHMLSYQTSLRILSALRSRYMAPGDRIFISAAGMQSELAQNYEGRHCPVSQRFFQLSDEMAFKHEIHGYVCLYELPELADLLGSAGFRVIYGGLSEAGIVDVEAEAV